MPSPLVRSERLAAEATGCVCMHNEALNLTARCARRRLAPRRYAASIITVQSISENKVFNLPMRQLPYLRW
jgi:hypothetical protein